MRQADHSFVRIEGSDDRRGQYSAINPDIVGLIGDQMGYGDCQWIRIKLPGKLIKCFWQVGICCTAGRIGRTVRKEAVKRLIRGTYQSLNRSISRTTWMNMSFDLTAVSPDQLEKSS